MAKKEENNDTLNLPCQICDKKFSTPTELNQHFYVVHENQRLLECPVCNKELKTNATLSTHIQRVHENKRPGP